MAEIDAAWLRERGVEADDKLIKELVGLTVAELELRVGQKLVAHFSDAELDEFESLEDEDERFNLLKRVYPEYSSVVREEKQKLSLEIKKADDKVELIKNFQD